MRKEIIFKIALMAALIGILALFLISEKVKPEAKRVCGVDREMEGKLVSVSGVIDEVYGLSNGGSSFNLYEGECSLKVVFFNEGLFVKKGGGVKVTGIIQSYRGELELVADRVEEI